MAVCRVYPAAESSSTRDGVHEDMYAVAGLKVKKN